MMLRGILQHHSMVLTVTVCILYRYIFLLRKRWLRLVRPPVLMSMVDTGNRCIYDELPEPACRREDDGTSFLHDVTTPRREQNSRTSVVADVAHLRMFAAIPFAWPENSLPRALTV